MSGRGKRVFNAADLRAMDRGKIVRVIPPGGGPARLEIPRAGARGRRSGSQHSSPTRKKGSRDPEHGGQEM